MVAGLNRATVDALNEPNATRASGPYSRLAWEIRFPALLAGCLMVFAVYGLGRTVGDHQLGILSACVCGTGLLFLQQTRFATTDIHLALWVTTANFFSALALIKERRWVGFVGAGTALGLAMMSKGPVCLVQSLVPAVTFVMARPRSFRRRGWIAPLAVGLFVMLLIVLPWYLWVAWRVPNTAAIWQEELNANNQEGYWNGWYTALALVPLLFPWFIYFVVGLIGGGQVLRLKATRTSPIVLVFLQVVVPLLVMTFFRNRKDRYLLPMVGPAAVLTAWALQHCLMQRDRGARALAAAHWAALAAVAVGFPLAGAFSPWLRTVDATPWYSAPVAITSAAIAAALIVAGVLAQRRWPLALPAGTVAVMLPLQALFLSGYRDSTDSRSEMRPLAALIRTLPPQTEAYSYRPGVEGRYAPPDLYIYLNRYATRVDAISDIPPATQPQALLICQPKWKSLSQLIPPPDAPDASKRWLRIDHTPEGANSWHLFVRGAAARLDR
jgi:4-amino-4-deoxy-L-arabinose transferase-like glycosyltransferase